MQWLTPYFVVLTSMQCSMQCYSNGQLLACNTVGATWAKSTDLLTLLRKTWVCNMAAEAVGMDNQSLLLHVIGI